MVTFPRTPSLWYSATVSNNIIADNVAGWDGAGISLLDALKVNLVNNTIVSNVTTTTAGVLFNTIGAPLASAGGTNCTNATATSSCPQPSGLVSIQNSAVLGANLPAAIICPVGYGNTSASPSATNGPCRTESYPLLANNIFWQNSADYIGVGGLSTAFQQNVVTLYNAFSGTPTANQTATGQCTADRSYWDLGVRGDTGPTTYAAGNVLLNPTYSVLTSTAGYTGASLHNTQSNPSFVSQYCDGSRIPPESCTNGAVGCGWAVPPGISDATVPNPIFNLTPVATVDEGNNWINMRWGPLSLSNPTIPNAPPLGNYGLTAAIDNIPSSVSHPSTDFFGNPRPETTSDGLFDPGAVEFAGGGGGGGAPTLASIAPATGVRNSAVPVTFTGTNLTGATWSTANTTTYPNITVTGLTVISPTSVTATLHLAPGTTLGVKNFSLTTSNGTSNTVPFTVTGGTAAFSAPSPALNNGATTTHSGTITVSNTATGLNAGPLTLTAAPTITKVGTAGGTFSITGGSCASGTAIAAGSNCTIIVQYVPSGTTTARAHVSITDTGAATATQTSVNFAAN